MAFPRVTSTLASQGVAENPVACELWLVSRGLNRCFLHTNGVYFFTTCYHRCSIVTSITIDKYLEVPLLYMDAQVVEFGHSSAECQQPWKLSKATSTPHPANWKLSCRWYYAGYFVYRDVASVLYLQLRKTRLVSALVCFELQYRVLQV